MEQSEFYKELLSKVNLLLETINMSNVSLTKEQIEEVEKKELEARLAQAEASKASAQLSILMTKKQLDNII